MLTRHSLKAPYTQSRARAAAIASALTEKKTRMAVLLTAIYVAVNESHDKSNVWRVNTQ